MHLVQILLPVEALSEEKQEALRRELTEKFGGVTAYSRAPAAGLWKDEGATIPDDIVVLEVMVKALDRGWWATYRRELEHAFAQSELVIRALPMERL